MTDNQKLFTRQEINKALALPESTTTCDENTMQDIIRQLLADLDSMAGALKLFSGDGFYSRDMKKAAEAYKLYQTRYGAPK